MHAHRKETATGAHSACRCRQYDFHCPLQNACEICCPKGALINNSVRVVVVHLALPPKLPEKYDHEIESSAALESAQCVAFRDEQANENEMI